MSRYSQTIERLFSDSASRTLAEQFVARFEGQPNMADRIEPLLHEAAVVNQRIVKGEISAEQGRAFLGSVAQNIGTPGHLVDDGISWLETGGQPQETQEEQQPAGEDETDGVQVTDIGALLLEKQERDRAAAERAMHNQARAAAQAEVVKYETMMKAPQGSTEWRAYWQNQHAQMAYRQALTIAQGATLEEPGAMPTGGEDVRAAIAGTPAATPAA